MSIVSWLSKKASKDVITGFLEALGEMINRLLSTRKQETKGIDNHFPTKQELASKPDPTYEVYQHPSLEEEVMQYYSDRKRNNKQVKASAHAILKGNK